jgi:hypothetical protein
MRNGFPKVPSLNFINMGYLLSIACTDRQCLTYHNDKLEDGHTFESYGIGEGTTIFLSQICAAFPIFIRFKFPTWKKARILVEGINTIGSLKSRFHEWVPRGKGAEFWIKTMEKR